MQFRRTDRCSMLAAALIAIVVLALGACTDTTGRVAAEKNPAIPDVPKSPQENVLYPVEVDSRWGFIDRNGEMAIAPQFEEVLSPEDNALMPFVHELYPVVIDGSRVFIRRDGTPVYAPGTYSNLAIGAVTSGLVSNDDGEVGFVDADSEKGLEPQYERLLAFSDGLAPFQKDGRWGYLDRSGAVVIEPQFDAAGYFSERLARVKLEESFGFIDQEGEFVVDPTYAGAGDFYNGYARIQETGSKLWGAIDRKGNTAVTPRYDAIGSFVSGRASVESDNKLGFVDTEGEEVVPPVYEAVTEFSEGIAGVREGEFWGFINRDGEAVTEFVFETVGSCVHNRAAVRQQGKVGFINSEGVLVIQPEYDAASAFSEDGAALARKDGLSAVIDADGNPLTEFKYQRARPFVFPHLDYPSLLYDIERFFAFGMASVEWSDSENTYRGYVDSQGNEVWVNTVPKPQRYAVSITSYTVARTMFPLHAALNEIQVLMGNNSYSIGPIDVAQRRLPDFAEQTAMNTIQLNVEGSWQVMAQLSENGIVELTVEDADGRTVLQREDSGFGAIVSVRSSELQ